jgi:hypothetical protein
MTVTIKGQAGKAFDEQERDFSELASSGSLSFESLGVDELAFTIEPTFLDARESEIPEEGQSVSLFIAGERVFSGIVTTVSNDWGAGALVVEVVVSGAWWWLEQTALSDLVDGDTERPQFRCAIGSVTGHITRLFERMEALGLPVALGDMDECYDIPTTTFRDASFGRALSELLRLVPDAVGWWDYSGDLPAFRLTRRKDPSEADTLTLGVDPVTEGSLRAEYSLKIDRVTCPYAERLETGETAFRSLVAGSGGTQQVFPVSGPELVDFVPPDPIDGVTISTVDIVDNSTSLDMANLELVWKFWQDWSERYPGVASTRTPTEWNGGTNPSDLYSNGLRPYVFLDDGTRVDTTIHPRYAVTYAPDREIPSWFSEVDGYQLGEIRGTVFLEVDASFNGEDWLQELMNEAAYVYTVIGGPDNLDRTIFFDLEIPVILLPTELTAKSFYKALAYEFEIPPSDLAENLRQAQAWTPYVGTIGLEVEGETFQRKTGSTINLAGGRSAWETMGGLVQGERLDLFSLAHVLNLGLPERLSGSTPVTRLERSSSDSVVLL